MTNFVYLNTYQLSGQTLQLFYKANVLLISLKLPRILIDWHLQCQSRLVASPYIIYLDNCYYLEVNKNMTETLFSYWKPFLMLSRVQAELIEHNSQNDQLQLMTQAIAEQSTFKSCLT